MAVEQSAKLLSGVEATGAGTATVLHQALRNHSLHATFTNSGGSVTALTVTLEGSLLGNNWITLGTIEFAAADLSNEGAMVAVANVPVKHVRANVTTLTETGTTAVSAQYLGVE